MSDSGTGIYTTSGKMNNDKTVSKGGRGYTYRNGRLVGVTRGAEDVDRANQQAAINQARIEDAAQQGDFSNSDLSTGAGGGKTGVQSATNAVLALLRSGGFNQPYKGMQAQLGTIYGQAGANISDANKALMDYLAANVTNPYVGVSPQAAVVQPQFQQLLQEQGVSGVPLQQELASQQGTAGESAAQFRNLLDVMSGVQRAGMESQRSEAQLADLFARQLLEANRAAAEQQLLGLGQERKTGLQDKLIELLAGGGSVPKSVLDKVLGVTKKPKVGGKTSGKGK